MFSGDQAMGEVALGGAVHAGEVIRGEHRLVEYARAKSGR